jgi:hypothetical protein
MDGDGYPELAAVDELMCTPVLLYNNDRGKLDTDPISVGERGMGNHVAWGDVDGDGNLDLAVGGQDYRVTCPNLPAEK